MNRLAELLFYIWILSFPFYRFSLLGTFSLDNLLAPALLLIWPLATLSSKERYTPYQFKNLYFAALFLFLYFLAHSITLITTQQLVWRSMYTVITDVIYIMLPVLYLRNDKIRMRAEDCIIIITTIGAVTGFLSATGVLHLEGSRFSTSRIDIEGLDLTRTVGLFPIYGDMALLSAFTLVAVLSATRERLLLIKRSKLTVAIILFVLLLGLLGLQSRNMVITIVIAGLIFLIIGRWSRNGPSWIPRFYTLFIGGGFSVAILIAMFWNPIFELLAGWGGEQASGTAHARLGQYQLAWELLKANPLTGASSETQERFSASIIYIHNMWFKELVQGGLIAIVALLLIIFQGMKNSTACLAINYRDDAARARLAFLIAAIASTQFNPSGTAVFWMLLGVAVARVCGPVSVSDQSVNLNSEANSLPAVITSERKHHILAAKKQE